MAISLLARTGTKLASGATSKFSEPLRRLGLVRSRGSMDGLLPRMFSSASGWDKKSLDEKFERQRSSYQEFLAREKQKADDRHQEYLRNCRHARYEKNFEELKKAVEKLDKGIQSGFKGVADEVVKTKDSLKDDIFDAHEVSSEDLLYLVLWLELMADELKDRLDLLKPTEGADIDIGQELVNSIPKVKLYYALVFGLKVALDAGVVASDVPNIVQEFHLQCVQELKDKLEKYHKK